MAPSRSTRLAVCGSAADLNSVQNVFFSTAMSKLLLTGAALSNLQREGRLAWLWVTHQDMVRACAAEEDCEGVVNYALSIADVEAAVFLRELPEERIRVSLRSKGESMLPLSQNVFMEAATKTPPAAHCPVRSSAP